MNEYKTNFQCPTPFGHYHLENQAWVNAQCGRWSCVVCGQKNWFYVCNLVFDHLGNNCRVLTLGHNNVNGIKIAKIFTSFQKYLYNAGLKIKNYVWLRTYDFEDKETLHLFTDSDIAGDILEDLWAKAAGIKYNFKDSGSCLANEELIKIHKLMGNSIIAKKAKGIKDGTKFYSSSFTVSDAQNLILEERHKKMVSVQKLIKCDHESVAHPDHKGKEEIVCYDIDTDKAYRKGNRPLSMKDMLDLKLKID